jgi:polyhydroxybutyrate depolymerase
MVHNNQRSSLRISSRRMIFVFLILLFISQSILYAQIQNGSFDFDGLTRNYMVYLPTNYTDSTNFPLVIHLHSGGWTAQQDMNYIKLNQVADTCGFIVVYPNAIGKRWNSGGVPAPDPDVDDVGFINALIDIMSNRYSIDLERIYACGYSRGGFMAYTLACQLGNRIAAIASVAGVLSTSVATNCNPLRTIPVLHIHGTADTWVPINGTSDIYSADQTISYWTSLNDCVQVDTTTLPDLDPTDGCTVERTTYTVCSENCDVVYYKVINGGHTWPGAGPPGYSAGKTTQDFNASVEIWNFFKNHKLVITPVVDFNGDGIVDTKDLLRVIEAWGQDNPMADIAPTFGDRTVDVLDLELFMSYWGQEIDDPTLIAHWALDETEGMFAGDSVSESDAYIIGGATWQPDGGQVNGAIQLNGVDGCVVTGPILNPAYGSFSILAWIKGGAPGQVIISQQDAANWLRADSEGNLKTELIGIDRLASHLQSQTIISDDNWHRIGFVWDGLSRKLYVDGILAAEDTQDNMKGSNSGLYLGCGKGMEAGTYWSGLIDDVRIYNRVVIP